VSPPPSCIVIGGGIVGLATAVALSESRAGGRSVTVLEAEQRVAAHQSGHNSGVIHSGLYYRPGTLKARLCREGGEALYRFCEAEGIPHRRSGKLVVAARESELPMLATLEERGRANGLQGLRRLVGAELRAREPAVAGLAGLWVPEAGVVDFAAVTTALARSLERRGGKVVTGARVFQVKRDAAEVVVESAAGPHRARLVINCAGLQADRVARLCGAQPDVLIVPFRGEYYHLVPERRDLVRTAIYPVPDPALPFLGVHLTRSVGGEVHAGPNAVLAWARHGYRRRDVSLRDLAGTLVYPGFWRMAARHWRAGVAEMARSFSKAAFLRALQRLVPALQAEDLVPGASGVRAQAVDRAGRLVDDFHILETPGAVHVLNAPSPAATASLAIGRAVAARALRQLGLDQR
jgi:(S)-2-hydroxyglutarate dehydrogenase